MEQKQVLPFYRKVLVIDDTEIDLLIAKMAMKKYAFAEEVVLKKSVLSGLEYLESIQQIPEELPQLIFVDINMPEIGGFYFLERFEELPETIRKNCNVIMLTTSLAEEDQKKAMENKFVSKFLNKPLDKIKLENIKTEFISKDSNKVYVNRE